MPNILRGKLFALIIFLASFIPVSSLMAQVGCGGFNGSPQPSGGVTSGAPGSLCLNDAAQIPERITITASNVADGNNPNNFAVVIDWDDGSGLQTINYGPGSPIVNTGPHSYEIKDIEHVFLPRPCNATMGRRCAYKPRIYLRIAGTTCPAEFGNPPDFFKYNTDDQCSGNMSILHGPTGTGTELDPYEVCAGSATTVTFNDLTQLNCLPPQELTGLNATRRWRRFVYGVANSNGADPITEGGPLDQIEIGGSAVSFPYNATGAPMVSGNSLTTSAPPFGNNNTLTIRIPATAKVGEEFRVRMQYWNVCNQYDDGVGAPPVNGDRPAVYREAVIRVVAQPTAPEPDNQVVCNNIGGTLPQFEIDPVTSYRITWYRDNNGAPSNTTISNPNGNNNRRLPASAFPGGINKSIAGVYRVWVKYSRLAGQNGNNNVYCESELRPVTLTIKPAIPTPVFASGDNEVCNGETGVGYSLQVPAAALSSPNPGNSAVPFNTEYFWDASVGGVTITSVNPGQGGTAQNATVNFNINDGDFGGSNSMTVNIRVRRRYTDNTCASTVATFPVTVHRNTTVGTISGGLTRCEGENLGDITWNPGVGTVQGWEISTNNGVSYNPIPSFGTSNPVDPTTLGLTSSGTAYRIRAIIRNGTCATVRSPHASFIINPNADVANAGPNQDLCILTPPFTTTLAANPAGGATGTWTVITRPPGAIINTLNVNNEASTFTVDRQGTYVLQWELDNGSCQSQSNVTIRFSEDPGVPNPHAGDFCSLEGTLDADAPTRNEVVTWSLISGPLGTSTASIANPDQIPTQVTVSDYGAYVFNLRFSSPGCPDIEDVPVTINFFESATSVSENDKTICVDGSVSPILGIPLTGTVGDGATAGRWEIVTGTGTFSSSAAGTGSDLAPGVIADNYIPSGTDYTNGTVTLRLVGVANAACGNATDQLVLTFDRKPTDADADLDDLSINTCGTTATLDAVAADEGGSGLWSEITTGPLVDDPTLANSPVQDLIVGANTFRWTVTSALGICAATTSDVIVTRHDAPVANTINPNNLCETAPNSGIAQSTDLTQYVVDITGGAANVDVNWYRDAARTIVVPDPLDEDVDDPLHVTVVRTDVTPACFTNAVVVFQINAAPFVSNVLPAVCEDPTTPGEVQNVDLENWNDDVSLNLWPTDRDVAWFEDAAFTIPVATPGDLDNVVNNDIYFARVTNNTTGCFNTAQVTFDVNEIPADNPINGPDKVCLDPNNVVYFDVTTFKVNHSYQWTIPAPPNGADVPTGITNDFFVLLQFPDVVAGGINLEVVETSPEGCPGNPQLLNVVVEDNPNSLTINGPSEICEGQESVVFETNINDPAITYFWNVPPGSSIVSGQNTNEIRVDFGPGSGTGNVIVTPSTSSGCVGTGSIHPIDINAKPELFIPPPQAICSNEVSGLILDTEVGSEPATNYNIITRIYDAGLFQTGGNAIVPILGASATELQDHAFENITGGPLNVRYTVEPVSVKNCIGDRGVITLIINPEPQLDPNLDKDLCSEEPTAITLRPDVGSYPANQYIIKSISNPDNLININPSPSVLNVPLNETAIYNDQWVQGGAPLPDFSTVQYEIAPVSIDGCEGFPAGTIEVRVFPKPIFDAITNPKTICSGLNENISLTTNNVGLAGISWNIDFVSNEVLGAQGGISGNQPALINRVLTNTTFDTQGEVRYRVTAENPISASKSCFSNPLIMHVFVDPAPEAKALSGTEVCSDAPNNGLVRRMDLTSLNGQVSSSGGVDFTWYTTYPTTQVLDPLDHPVVSGTNVFVEVRNTTSQCTRMAPVSFIVTNDVDLDLTGKDLTCHDDGTGTIRASNIVPAQPPTGTAPFSYQLDANPFVSSVGDYTFTSLDAGSYTVTIRDSKGCTATKPITIAQPLAPLVLSTPVITEVSCYFDTGGLDRDGRIEVQASGGTENNGGANYTYTLLPGNTVNNTGVFTGLRQGVYSITVTDETAGECEDEAFPVTVIGPDPLEITSVTVAEDAFGNNISCKDATNGLITVTAEGGNDSPAQYNYTIAPLVGLDLLPDVPGDNISPAQFTNMGAGTFGIVVEDAKGCKSPRSLTFIAPLPALDGGLVGFDQSICFDQPGHNADEFIELAPATGGTGQYVYEWQQSVTGDVSVDAHWFAIPGATSATFDPDAASNFGSDGTYYYRRLVRTTSTLPDRPAFCDDPAGKAKKVSVIVNPRPVVTFEPAATEICEGLPLVIDVGIQLGTGTLPLTYEYEIVGDGIFQNEISPKIIIPNLQNDRTFILNAAKDANGCEAVNIPIQRDITVIKLNSDFQVNMPDAQCSGEEFSFSWVAEPDVNYTWEFGDGATETYTGLSGAQVEQHVYNAGSTSSETLYPVRLTAARGLCPPKPTNRQVTVYPQIILNLLPQETQLCSGETLVIKDQSLGVSTGTWFYRADTPGNTDRLEPKPGPVTPLTYVMENNSPATLNLVVVYEAENAYGCKATDQIPVTVYRGVDADFTVGPIPPFAGGVSEVTLTNTSIPNDVDFDFNYGNHGDDNAVLTSDDGIVRTVEYYSPGAREITLKATNIEAGLAGKSCVSTHTVQINIDQPGLDAAFIVTPGASCLPVELTVDNQSPGADTFLWQLLRNGEVIDETTVTEPVWSVSAPGTYTVTLLASYSESTQPAVFLQKGDIQVFDNPIADFELFQARIYKGTVFPVINRSINASEFLWNFGDHPESANSKSPSPTYSYESEGEYLITLTAFNDHVGPFDLDGDGVEDGNVVCSDVITKNIFVQAGGSLKIPNAFTPNVSNPDGSNPGDGTNDIFLPVMDGVEEFTMHIFDRWGTLIFESQDKTKGWNGYDRNGRLMPAGVYVYKVVLRLGDDTRTTKIGDVTLIR